MLDDDDDEEEDGALVEEEHGGAYLGQGNVGMEEVFGHSDEEEDDKELEGGSYAGSHVSRSEVHNVHNVRVLITCALYLYIVQYRLLVAHVFTCTYTVHVFVYVYINLQKCPLEALYHYH